MGLKKSLFSRFLSYTANCRHIDGFIDVIALFHIFVKYKPAAKIIKAFTVTTPIIFMVEKNISSYYLLTLCLEFLSWEDTR
jgi:hypothetical protein